MRSCSIIWVKRKMFVSVYLFLTHVDGGHLRQRGWATLVNYKRSSMPDVKSTVWCPEFIALQTNCSVTDKTHCSREETVLISDSVWFYCPESLVVLWRRDEQEAGNQWLCFKAYFFRPRPTESLREQQSDRRTPCGRLNSLNCHRKYNLWWL